MDWTPGVSKDREDRRDSEDGGGFSGLASRRYAPGQKDDGPDHQNDPSIEGFQVQVSFLASKLPGLSFRTTDSLARPLQSKMSPQQFTRDRCAQFPPNL